MENYKSIIFNYATCFLSSVLCTLLVLGFITTYFLDVRSFLIGASLIQKEILGGRPHSVDPHKIETCFRTFPKFKLTNAPHFQLMQNRRRIRAGYSPNSFFKAVVVHKTGCVVCAIYA